MAKNWTWLFRALAVGFLCAGVFHAAAFRDGTLEPRMSPSGHALFVAINLVVAVGMLIRPRGFIALFAVLCVQQLISHGEWAWKAWHVGNFDWRSIIVLVTMPLMLFALIRDARLRQKTAYR